MKKSDLINIAIGILLGCVLSRFINSAQSLKGCGNCKECQSKGCENCEECQSKGCENCKVCHS